MKITTLFVFIGLVLLSATPQLDQTALTQEDIKVILERHNFWREEVGVNEKLEWSDEMAKVAAEWAKELKEKGCEFIHRPNNKFGENLFKGTTGHFDAAYVVNAWADEKADYNYNRNKCKPGKMCGHYTQIVWQTTQRVGCAKIVCDGYDIWVCNYDPPGNWVGERPY